MSSSAIITAILSPEGLKDTPYIVTSLAEAVQYEPEGIYTVTRTYHSHKSLLLDAHLDRLEESAHLENIPLILDRDKLRQALRQLLTQANYADSRFRITIPRDNPAWLYLALEPLKPVPQEARNKGVNVVTLKLSRFKPAAKTTDWMAKRAKAIGNLATDTYEAILVNAQNELLEGTGSNFYAILNGTLRTAGKGVLMGISRKVVMNVALDVLPVQENPITLNDIPHLSDAFMTSSSRAIVPIVNIDGQIIGNGTPGAKTCELSRHYDAWTEAHLEAI